MLWYGINDIKLRNPNTNQMMKTMKKLNLEPKNLQTKNSVKRMHKAHLDKDVGRLICIKLNEKLLIMISHVILKH